MSGPNLSIRIKYGMVITGGHFIPVSPIEQAAHALYHDCHTADHWASIDESAREWYRRVAANPAERPTDLGITSFEDLYGG